MRFLVAGLVGLFACLCASATWADVTEMEPNNSFSTRQVVIGPDRVVNGSITDLGGFDFNDYTQSWSASLGPQDVHFYDYTEGVSPGQSFIAWTYGSLDTALGVFDENGDRVSYDRDSGFVFFADSALGGVASSDSSIHLGVSADDDYNFIGNHNQSGSYNLFLKLDGSFADVDYYSFTGLTPGTQFTAEITAGDFDTLLGLFNDDGTWLFSDDDNGSGNLSMLQGLVPNSGIVNLAVTFATDTSFIGLHDESGTYTLTLTAVPEPATLAMWLAGGVMGLCWWSRRRRAAA